MCSPRPYTSHEDAMIAKTLCVLGSNVFCKAGRHLAAGAREGGEAA